MFTYHPSEDDELPLFSTGMIGQYAHGNEPSHHVIYLFNSIGFNDRTQYYVAKVMNELYKNEPAGLCGNETADRCRHGTYSVLWDSIL